ncbi:MAG: DUF4136 domain-containing protein [Sphingomonas bacterium]|nr:DUF4136 domain-containing protein [Sphingomonas bacterium]
MRINKLAASALLAVSALGLNACATGFPTQVSRYQAMPAPQGQSFFVVAANPARSGGLEFTQYATIVAQAMQAQGYVPAASPQAATMLVAVDYGVDQGQQEIVHNPFDRGYYGSAFGNYYDPFFRRGYYGNPYYSRYGSYRRRSPFFYGWDDPFWGSPFDSPYGGARSYTVYKSYLDVDIRRRVDNAALFEGHAKARSQSDNLGALVPNLIEAMFTGFPGRNGETVKITVPPAPRTR